MDLSGVLREVKSAVVDVGESLWSRPVWWTPGVDSSTNTDKEVDRRLADSLRSILDVPILSEEADRTQRGTDWLWVVDPIDGTLNYLAGSAEFATCVALVSANSLEPALGVVHAPLLRMTFSALKGGGAFLNDARIDTRAGNSAQKPPFIAIGLPADANLFPAKFGGYFQDLVANGWVIRQSGSAAFDICRTAAGIWTAFHEAGLKRWDVAAADLVASEARCLKLMHHSSVPSQANDKLAFDYLICRDEVTLHELGPLLMNRSAHEEV